MAGLNIGEKTFMMGTIVEEREAFQLCLDLAKKGLGSVSPNPPVGCIVLNKDRKLIGFGYHTKVGEAHAEVEAFRSVSDKSQLNGSIVYVTLEPCSFEGRTPSCAKMLIEHPIAEVVFGQRDPHPKVSGEGLKILEKKGVKVRPWGLDEEDVIQKELVHLTRPFFVNHSLERSFLSLKAASTLDGQIAMNDGESQWITCEKAREFGHILRSQHDAIAVGNGTILSDNPKLNVRHPKLLDKTLRPIVFDLSGKLREQIQNLEVYKCRPSEDILVVSNAKEWVGLSEEQLIVPKCLDSGEVDMDWLLKYLWSEHNISSVYLEGGSKTIASVLRQGLWDRFYLFTGYKIIGSDQGRGWSGHLGLGSLNQAKVLNHIETKHFPESQLNIFCQVK
tara:strand:+ start:57474 stop:58643 length:1170 start_codon:yes stop_codon:yes gene_type:complete